MLKMNLILELVYSKVLHGNEEALGELIEAYTPKVKGSAYGYPCDYFKYEEWQAFKINDK